MSTIDQATVEALTTQGTARRRAYNAESDALTAIGRIMADAGDDADIKAMSTIAGISRGTAYKLIDRERLVRRVAGLVASVTEAETSIIPMRSGRIQLGLAEPGAGNMAPRYTPIADAIVEALESAGLSVEPEDYAGRTAVEALAFGGLVYVSIESGGAK